MKISRRLSVFGLCVILIGLIACSTGPVSLSQVKLSKDKSAAQETSTFAATDTVYAVSTVSNAPGKVKVKGALAVEEVTGMDPGPIPGLEKTLDLDGSGTATFTFSPPEAGWPKGKYKVNVVMMNDQGQQTGQNSGSFTVS